jgi:sulfur transfer complex TusBCD TusB component (DsrH family)
MSEILSKLDGAGVIAMFAVAGGLVLAFVAILASAWTKVRQAEAVAALKQDLAARGMSAEEIRNVLEAGSKCSLRTLAKRVFG